MLKSPAAVLNQIELYAAATVRAAQFNDFAQAVYWLVHQPATEPSAGAVSASEVISIMLTCFSGQSLWAGLFCCCSGVWHGDPSSKIVLDNGVSSVDPSSKTELNSGASFTILARATRAYSSLSSRP